MTHQSPPGVDAASARIADAAVLRRSAASAAIAIVASVGVTVVVSVALLGLGFWWGGYSPDAVQSREDLRNDGAGVLALLVILVGAFALAPLSYLVSFVAAAKRLLPKGQRAVPRVVIVGAMPLALLLAAAAYSTWSFVT